MQFSLGAALTVTAGIGVASVNAFALTISEITDVKVGTYLALFNIGFALAYALMTKFKYIVLGIIQIASFVLFGYILNFLVYDVFKDVVYQSYFIKVFLLSLGISLAASAIGVVTLLRIITFPVEMVCHHLEVIGVMSFMKARYLLDIILIILAIIFTLIFETNLYLREGTIITVVLFSFVMNASKNFAEKHLVHKLF
jgi:uncharacterized membrane protein YczE